MVNSGHSICGIDVWLDLELVQHSDAAGAVSDLCTILRETVDHSQYK